MVVSVGIVVILYGSICEEREVIDCAIDQMVCIEEDMGKGIKDFS